MYLVSSLGKEVVFFTLHLVRNRLQGLARNFPLEDGLCQTGVLLLQDLELALYLVSCLVELAGDDCEVTAELPEELEEGGDFCFGPVGDGFLGFLDDAVLVFEFVGESDFVDEGGESGD